MPARSPIPPPARGRRRFIKPRRLYSMTPTTPRRCSDCRHSETSTPASEIRPRPCWKSALPRLREAPPPSQSHRDTPHTKAIFIESIANPSGSVTDIEAISAVARKAGVPLIVDNTLATPYLIRPIDHGADIVVHSLTKFLGGHGNSIGGIIVDAGTFDWSKDNKYPMLSEPRPEYHGIKLQETFGNFAFAIACRVLGLRDLGPAISPFNAFLILTGIETLPLRMQKHCENAKAIA